nr:Sperm-associated antigen 16 protein [Polyrhizophydium stewartii]
MIAQPPPPLPTKISGSKLGDAAAPAAGGAGAAKASSLPPVDEDSEPKMFYLEQADHAVEDSDEELEFEEIPVEQFDDYSDSDVDETLEQAVRNIHEKNFFGSAIEPVAKTEELTPALTKHPEVIDDYIRNYLSSKGLVKSLEAFQNEWYEFQQKERLAPEDVTIVPDVYQQNQELADALQKLRVDVETYKEIANKARATYDKLRKERDFHRMHHKRVVQEKNKLIADIKRLKKHYENYEPTLKQLQHKYEMAMKEKMLTKLERDRLAAKVAGLEGSVKGLEKSLKDASSDHAPQPAGAKRPVPTKDATLPSDDRANPYASAELPVAKYDRLKQIHQVKAHNLAISSLKFHPKKLILATVSDDRSWKMWAFPSGELIMSGEGHKDWIADCDFHPRGTQLATSSGDGTVKLWDFSKGIATLTMSDHTQAVWSCAFHDQGDFLASGSMDHTANGRCRQTFRGHADSVNHVGWQPFTNTLFTCSGDKTGTTFASCDADGVVKFWDTRAVSELASLHFGPHPANKICLDPSGTVLAVASNDGLVRMISTAERVRGNRDLRAHEDSVQAVAFDRTAEFLVSSGSDGTFKIFQ